MDIYFFLVGLVWEGGTDLQNAIKDKHKSGRPTITASVVSMKFEALTAMEPTNDKRNICGG